MNGAESLVRTLLACGVDTCFANPGTSEMHFVAALDRIPGMRCVLGLFEGVVTGMADGYARMADRPAATLLHCGPGLANGLANLHNARRAGSPMVNCVGDQATFHRPLDAPLTADTVGFARAVSGWVRTAAHAADVGADAVAAVRAAWEGNGQIATLILPSDTCWDGGGIEAPALARPVPAVPDRHAIDRAAQVLRARPGTLLLLGGRALREAPLRDAQRIATRTGARLMAEQSNARISRGRGRVPIDRVPYPVDQAVSLLADVQDAILVGARDPVGFFAYPGKPGRMLPEAAALHVLARPEHDLAGTLAALADALDSPPAPVARASVGEVATGAVTPARLGQSLAALLPEQSVVIDECVSVTGLYEATRDAAPHDWLALTGGAIGVGLPLATGAAVGAPGRRVVALQADGSGMYTLQSLWTQAREALDVTTVILSNRAYAILRHEITAVGANPGRTALDMFDLSRPDLDWVRLAGGMGVPGARAETMTRFNDLFAASVRAPGPFLIELVL